MGETKGNVGLVINASGNAEQRLGKINDKVTAINKNAKKGATETGEAMKDSLNEIGKAFGVGGVGSDFTKSMKGGLGMGMAFGIAGIVTEVGIKAGTALYEWHQAKLEKIRQNWIGLNKEVSEGVDKAKVPGLSLGTTAKLADLSRGSYSLEDIGTLGGSIAKANPGLQKDAGKFAPLISLAKRTSYMNGSPDLIGQLSALGITPDENMLGGLSEASSNRGADLAKFLSGDRAKRLGKHGGLTPDALYYIADQIGKGTDEKQINLSSGKIADFTSNNAHPSLDMNSRYMNYVQAGVSESLVKSAFSNRDYTLNAGTNNPLRDLAGFASNPSSDLKNRLSPEDVGKLIEEIKIMNAQGKTNMETNKMIADKLGATLGNFEYNSSYRSPNEFYQQDAK